MQPFVFINEKILIIKVYFFYFLVKIKKYAFIYVKVGKIIKNVLCVKIKYNIESEPSFLFIVAGFQYSKINRNKDKIYKLVGNSLSFNLRLE